ncbi:uncharacterized protein PF3D7_1120600-like isoform X2 [Condylostylus longicornis]|uniref:uncharacterized protein PF3D7_1120600-like isoform X2 n=1 Tax=Condylostylus longicornis TaxID=2530218 RepID=UPI00244DA9E3|nr:uncharacterized protein PF3D7_1120600-like isoform X2 [Condylostylus longicornis]
MSSNVFEPGDIVWVKLSNSWWPGEVWDLNEVPDDLSSLKKKPIAVVKFFKEDSYEYVKNVNSIYEYNCPKKNDFIKKGLESKRSSNNSFSDKFREDVITAEKLTGGDINILENLSINKQASATRRSNIVKMIFGDTSSQSSQKKTQQSPKNNQKSNLTEKSPRILNNLRGRSVVTVKNIIKPSISTPNINNSPQKTHFQSSNSNPNTPSAGTYRCHLCSFTSMRQNVIILHSKTHLNLSGSSRLLPENNRYSTQNVPKDNSIIVIDDDSDSDNVSRTHTPQTLVTTIDTSSDSQIIDVSLSPQESLSSSSSGNKTISAKKILPFRASANSDKKKKIRGNKNTNIFTSSTPMKTNTSSEMVENIDIAKNKTDHIPLIKPPKKQFRKGILKDIFEDWSDDDTASQNNVKDDSNRDISNKSPDNEVSLCKNKSHENLGCSRLDESDVEVLKNLQQSERNDKNKSPLTIQKIRNIPKKDRQRNIILEDYSDSSSNITPNANIILENRETISSNAQHSAETIEGSCNEPNLKQIDSTGTTNALSKDALQNKSFCIMESSASELNHPKTDNNFDSIDKINTENRSDSPKIIVEEKVDTDSEMDTEKRSSVAVVETTNNVIEETNEKDTIENQTINNDLVTDENSQKDNCASDRPVESEQIESPEFEPINDVNEPVEKETQSEEPSSKVNDVEMLVEHSNSINNNSKEADILLEKNIVENQNNSNLDKADKISSEIESNSKENGNITKTLISDNAMELDQNVNVNEFNKNCKVGMSNAEEIFDKNDKECQIQREQISCIENEENEIVEKQSNGSENANVEDVIEELQRSVEIPEEQEDTSEKSLEMVKPHGRNKRFVAHLNKSLSNKIRKSSRKSDNIYKILGREISTPSPVVVVDSPLHVQMEAPTNSQYETNTQIVTEKMNEISDETPEIIQENSEINEEDVNKEIRDIENIEINEEDTKTPRKMKKKSKQDSTEKKRTDSDRFIEFLENEIKATPSELQETEKCEQEKVMTENLPIQEKPVGRTLRERKIRKEYTEIDEDSFTGEEKLQYHQTDIESTKLEMKTEKAKESDEPISPISNNLKSSKPKKVGSRQNKATKSQVLDTKPSDFSEDREIIPKLIIKSSKESGKEATLKVMTVSSNVTDIEKTTEEKMNTENEVKKGIEKVCPKSPKKSPKKSYSKQKSVERKLFRKDSVEQQKVDKIRKDDTPATIFDFQEEDDTELVLTSLSKLKKKFMSPDKQKESDLFPSMDKEKQKQIEKEDEKLKVEIENLLNDTRMSDISLVKTPSKTVSTTVNNSTNLQNSVTSDEVKTLPIKERGKRFFKSRNVSRNEEHQTVPLSLNTSTHTDKATNNNMSAITTDSLADLQKLSEVKKLNLNEKHQEKQSNEIDEILTSDTVEKSVEPKTEEVNAVGSIKGSEITKEDEFEMGKELEVNERDNILLETSKDLHISTTNLKDSRSESNSNSILNENGYNVQTKEKERKRGSLELKTNDLEKLENEGNLENSTNPETKSVSLNSYDTNLIESTKVAPISLNQNVLLDTNLDLQITPHSVDEEISVHKEENRSNSQIISDEKTENETSGNNITRRRRSHLKVTPRKKNVLEEGTELGKHQQESQFRGEFGVEKEPQKPTQDNDQDIVKNTEKEENSHLKIEEVSPKMSPKKSNENIGPQSENSTEKETAHNEILKNIALDNVDPETIRGKNEYPIKGNLSQKGKNESDVDSVKSDTVISEKSLLNASDAIISEKSFENDQKDKSHPVNNTALEKLQNSKNLEDEKAKTNSDCSDAKKEIIVPSFFSIGEESKSELNKEEAKSDMPSKTEKVQTEKSITEQYEANFVEKYMKDAGMLNLTPLKYDMQLGTSAELTNITPRTLQPDSYQESVKEPENTDSIAKTYKSITLEDIKQTELHNIDLEKIQQTEIVVNKTYEIPLIEQAKAIVAKVNATESLSDIRSFRPKRKYPSRQSSISVSTENLSSELLTQSEDVPLNSLKQSIGEENASEIKIPDKLNEKENDELIKNSNNCGYDESGSSILGSSSCPDFHILKAVDRLAEAQQNTNSTQIQCRTSTSPGNTRITVDSENPLATQIANILATGSDTKSIKTNEISNKSVNKITTLTSITKKRKLSIEEDIPTFIIDKTASVNTPVMLNEALKETTIKNAPEKPQKISESQKPGSVKKLLLVPPNSLQEEKEKNTSGNEQHTSARESSTTENLLKNLKTKETKKQVNENSSATISTTDAASTENVFDISTLPILLTTNEEMLQDNIQFVITQEPVLPHDDRQQTVEQILTPNAKKIRGRPRKSDPSLPQTTCTNSPAYNQILSNNVTQQKLPSKMAQHTSSLNSTQHSGFIKKSQSGITSALSQISTVESCSQTYNVKATSSRELGVDSSGNSIVLIQYGKNNQKLMKMPKTPTEQTTSLDEKTVSNENSIKTSENIHKQQLGQLSQPQQQPQIKSFPNQRSGQIVLPNKGTDNITQSTNVQHGNQFTNNPSSSNEVVVTPLYESGTVAQKPPHQQLTQISQQPGAQNSKPKKSHLQRTTYVGGENSEVIIRQIQQQQQEQQQQKQCQQMTNAFNQRGRKRKELETPIIPPNQNLNTQQRNKQQKLEQPQSQQLNQTKLSAHNQVASSSSSIHYDNTKTQILPQIDSNSCAIPNQTQNQSQLQPQATLPQQTSIQQQQQHQLQQQQLLQQQQQQHLQQQQLQRQQQQQQKQLLIEEEIAANKIMAVPANHFGIPGSAYYLCSQDNEGNYMPIDNQELYLDPESNQLVPLSVLNAKTVATAAPDGSGIIDGSQQMNLMETGTDSTNICIDPAKQNSDNSAIASNTTSVDNVDVGQQFVPTNNLTAAELSNILSPDQSICINIDGQQLILDQQSFLALVAAGGENTQLETQDGQILQLTGEFLAALGIGVNNNENVISTESGASCSGGDENSSGGGEQILLQTASQDIAASTDILASALIDVLQIETSQVSLVNTGGVGVPEEGLGPAFQALTPPVTAQTNETNALLTQPPIMSTLEVPSNKKKPSKQLDNETLLLNTISGVSSNINNSVNNNNVNNEQNNNISGSNSVNLNNTERILATPQNLEDCIAFIGVSTQSTTVPSSLELPITVTNPAIAPPKTTAPLGGLFNTKSLIVESSQISPQLINIK